MKLFLIKGKITKTPYMCDSKHFYEDRIVWANDEDEAKAKFVHHFEERSESYSVTYWAEVVAISEAIA